MVIGVAGGYANGPSILIPATNSTFRTQIKLGALWFDNHVRRTNAVLGFEPNGKLWVSDTTTSRMLRFMTDGGCDAWIMYVPHTYFASADFNKPERVFNQFLEFRVDYSLPLTNGGWVLTNYWGFNVPRGDATQNGLFCVTTISNHTYALVLDPLGTNNCDVSRRIAEITTNGLRYTAISNMHCLTEMERDGAIQKLVKTDGTCGTSTTMSFERRSIASIDANGDPVYAITTITSVVFTNCINPGYYNFEIGDSDRLIIYHDDRVFAGKHLGAVSTNGQWLWQTMPSGPLDGRGTFDTNCNQAGAQAVVVNDNVFCLYTGEGWSKPLDGQTGRQANQIFHYKTDGTFIFHYKTDGTFVAQFGMPAWDDVMPNAIGSASNMQTLSPVVVNGVTYLYTNDERGRGTHRWRIEP
jgi:hypothetical protein